ncbi:HNH endonuclease [Mucilaginibacter sp.]|uniref:HNH endonuclease n=1 Tax=Mucilaginibacter sp. TaxID=1882438 RepID=UPI003AFFFC36
MNPIFAPLPFKNIKYLRANNKRILFFDPEIVYQTQPVNIYKRIQASLEFAKMFPPKPNNTCACGCGETLTGRRTRWATKACTVFATQIWEIIDGRQATIKKFITLYTGGWKCINCNSSKHVKLDHIIPVKLGGGGCWLNNYQLLCHNCHVQKTNLDFGWKQSAESK